MARKQKFYFKKDSSETLYNLRKYPLAVGFLIENWNAIIEQYKLANKDATPGAWKKPAQTKVEPLVYAQLIAALKFSKKKPPATISFYAHGTHGKFVTIRPK